MRTDTFYPDGKKPIKYEWLVKRNKLIPIENRYTIEPYKTDYPALDLNVIEKIPQYSAEDYKVQPPTVITGGMLIPRWHPAMTPVKELIK
jgi:hypothetical protein